MPSKSQYWLVKSEPECFSIHDLAASPKQTTCWSGVRNYQARNFMRDGMKLGDLVLYYHSSTEPPAIVGVAEVVRTAYADSTAWDPHDDHYDPKASPENPLWQMVDLRLKEIFSRELPLPELRERFAGGHGTAQARLAAKRATGEAGRVRSRDAHGPRGGTRDPRREKEAGCSTSPQIGREGKESGRPPQRF